MIGSEHVGRRVIELDILVEQLREFRWGGVTPVRTGVRNDAR